MAYYNSYNYVAIHYSGNAICLYYIDKNKTKKKISFYTMDAFTRKESEVTYLNVVSSNQTLYIDDPTKLVAELVAINYGPFILFDDCARQRRSDTLTHVDYYHHSEFNILYRDENFNRDGVFNVLKNHGFIPETIDVEEYQIAIIKDWLLKKCQHIFNTCYQEGECDPDCRHFKFKRYKNKF
jgi:hypothetical protein